jgi:phosphomannomutase
LAQVFKAYDIRGVVPEQFDATVAQAVGSAFVPVANVMEGSGTVVLGYDMRPSSPELARAFAAGVTMAGADVVDIGLASTDLLYFASGRFDLPGAMFTASHNPPQYNGIKLCRSGAAPVGIETGLAEIRTLVERGGFQDTDVVGSVEHRNLLTAYADHLNELAPVRGRRLKVVVDAGNGMAGHTVPAVFAGIDAELIPLFFELDGTFPNHEANPIDPDNVRDLQAKVLETEADLGLAFDGDADRCFVIDEQARIVTPSVLTALIATRELGQEPGARIIYNLITSRAVPEIVKKHGGEPIRSRVGHSYIKATMAETGAIFGGEHSGHFYFRDFWRADSGMLAALHTMAALAETDQPLSALLTDFALYVPSGEINSVVADQAGVLAAVEAAHTDSDGVTVDHLDGLTVEHADWWFNLRPSNTEPVLRLNAEGIDEVTMQRVRDDVLALIRSDR